MRMESKFELEEIESEKVNEEKFELEGKTIQIAVNLFLEKRSQLRNESLQPSAVIIDSSGQKKGKEKKSPSKCY